MCGEDKEFEGTCEGCFADKDVRGMLFDEWEEIFFCDVSCFTDWAQSSNEVLDYYFKRNVEKV